jgi:hypothetical protein
MFWKEKKERNIRRNNQFSTEVKYSRILFNGEGKKKEKKNIEKKRKYRRNGENMLSLTP